MARLAPGDGLLHPLALAAIAALAWNDHWGKAAFPGLVTGKLSDFAGLLFFPLLLQAGVEVALSAIGRPWSPSLRVLGASAALTALVFAAVKLDTPMTAVYRVGLGALQWPVHAASAALGGHALPGLREVVIVADPTDLAALPMVLVAVAVSARRCGRRTPSSSGWRRSAAPPSSARP